jgi:hypothetical protein
LISIVIPEFDLSIKRDEAQLIPRGQGGIYFFYDASDELLYIGLAVDLRLRISLHLSGHSNTSRHSHRFARCSMLFENDPLSRKLYEMYLIGTLQPPLNSTMRYIPGEFAPDDGSVFKPQQSLCQGTTLRGTRCRQRAHGNGFCHLHGGNGDTQQAYMEKVRQQYLSQCDALE